MEVITVIKNFIETDSLIDANNVDLELYRWSERFSCERGRYVFVVRAKK